MMPINLAFLYGDDGVTGDILWCAFNPALPTTTARLIALTASGFETRCEEHPCRSIMSGATAIPLLQPMPGVLLTYARKGLGYKNSKLVPCGEVNLFRSTDAGATWTACEPTWVHFVTTVGGGIVYALDYGPAGDQVDPQIWRSDDGGATWNVQSVWVAKTGPYTPATGAAPSHIIVNPVYPDQVRVRQNAYWISDDGGVTFTGQGFNVGGDGGDGAAATGIYSPDGNWFVYGARAVGASWGAYLQDDSYAARGDAYPVGTIIGEWGLPNNIFATASTTFIERNPYWWWTEGHGVYCGLAGITEVLNGTAPAADHLPGSTYHPDARNVSPGLDSPSPLSPAANGYVPGDLDAGRLRYRLAPPGTNASCKPSVFFIVNGDTDNPYETMEGHVFATDHVQAVFVVPAGCSGAVVSLTSWVTTPPDPEQINIEPAYSDDRGTFGPGTHSLEVDIPNDYFRVLFLSTTTGVPTGTIVNNIVRSPDINAPTTGTGSEVVATATEMAALYPDGGYSCSLGGALRYIPAGP